MNQIATVESIIAETKPAKREAMHFRKPYEYALPTKKQVGLRIRRAKSPEERKVWRDLLNSSAFSKHKFEAEERENRKDKKLDDKGKKASKSKK